MVRIWTEEDIVHCSDAVDTVTRRSFPQRPRNVYAHAERQDHIKRIPATRNERIKTTARIHRAAPPPMSHY